ncbi:hypothetical protein K435DRAFT_857469, partial [Dendrothele bispora CBS 962.96]
MKSTFSVLTSITVLVQLIPSFVFAQNSLTLQFVPGADIPIPTNDVTVTPVSTLDGGAATVYEFVDTGNVIDASGTHQVTQTIFASASGWNTSVGVKGAVSGVQIECHQVDGDSNGSCEMQAGAGVGSVDATNTGTLSNIVLPIATGAGSSGSGSGSSPTSS